MNPLIYLLILIPFFTLFLLYLRGVAIRKSSPAYVSDDQWAEDAQIMHYMQNGTHKITL